MTEHEFLELGEAALAFKAVASSEPAPPMVDFRGHDGRFRALPYRCMESIAFDDPGGIAVDFTDHRVLLRGRNLRPLYDALVRHRVVFVQEGDLDFLSESETFVDSIVIAPTDTDLEPGA